MNKPPGRSPRARLIKKSAASDESPARSEDRAPQPAPKPSRAQSKTGTDSRPEGSARSRPSRDSSTMADRPLLQTHTSPLDPWGVLPDRPLFPGASRAAKPSRAPHRAKASDSLFTRKGQKAPRHMVKRKRPRARAASPPLKRLTPEQCRQIEERYRAMVAAGERPPEGRRKTIARELGLPYVLVSEAVKNYLHRERLRRTNFEIEKIYWHEVLSGQDDAHRIAERAAAHLNLDLGRVWWWLEKLHKWRKALENEPEVSPEQRAAILALYQDYLKRPAPPDRGLHGLISETVGGITPRQVHKVLLEYRLSFWNRLKNTVRPTGEPSASGQPVPPAGNPIPLSDQTG